MSRPQPPTTTAMVVSVAIGGGDAAPGARVEHRRERHEDPRRRGASWEARREGGWRWRKGRTARAVMPRLPQVRHALGHGCGGRVCQVADDPAVGEEQHAVGRPRRPGRGHHDHGLGVEADGLLEQRQDLARTRGVQGPRRLVGEDRRRGGHERPRDRRALLLTAEKLGRPIPRRPARSTRSRTSRLRSGSARPGEAQRQGDVLQDGQRREQVNCWKTKPMRSRRNVVSAVSSVPVISRPVDEHAPGRRSVGRRRPAGGALPRAGQAHDGGERRGRQPDGDVVQRPGDARAGGPIELETETSRSASMEVDVYGIHLCVAHILQAHER